VSATARHAPVGSIRGVSLATRTRTTDGVLPALLAAVVVSLVLGIVGMHALTTHGLGGGAGHAAMDMPTATTAHLSSHDAPTTVEPTTLAAAAAAAAVPSVVAGGDTGHGVGHMMMLCVAMIALGTGTLLLALLGLRRLTRLWAHLATAATALFNSFRVRVANGPPPVWEFSVIRC
jgi:hypothetical protein